MVHALSEIHRTLKPDGILIDLRPVMDSWTVEVHSASGEQIAGNLTDIEAGKDDDRAAFAAMQHVEARRWFSRQEEQVFSIFYHWNTPSEMKEFLDAEWGDFEKVEEDIYRKTVSIWTIASADANVRVRLKMLITRWKKLAVNRF